MQKINFTTGKLYKVGNYLTIELFNGIKTVYRGIIDEQQAQELRNNPKVTDLTAEIKPTQEQKTKLRELICQAKMTKGTNYFKTLIEGNTGIYLAHPLHGHSDYNKSRIFDRTPAALRLVQIFNRIANN